MAKDQRIRFTVYDNYIRGLPAWLVALKGSEHLTLVKHDITDPLPQDIGDFHYVIHAASIASPPYYRRYPIETMDANVNGLRRLLEYFRQQQAEAKPVEGFLFFSMGILPLSTFRPLRVTAATFLAPDRGPATTRLNGTERLSVSILLANMASLLKLLVRLTIMDQA